MKETTLASFPPLRGNQSKFSVQRQLQNKSPLYRAILELLKLPRSPMAARALTMPHNPTFAVLLEPPDRAERIAERIYAY